MRKENACKKILEVQKRLPGVRKKWLAFLQLSDKRLTRGVEPHLQEKRRIIDDLERSITKLEKEILQIQCKIKKTLSPMRLEYFQDDIIQKNKEIIYLRRESLYWKRRIRKLEKELQEKNQCRKRMLLGGKHQIELDRILKLPLILAVDIDAKKNAFRVYTDTIYIPYQERLYEIGMFRITFRFWGFTEIFFFNLCSTHLFNEDHPYARNGLFCFGYPGVSVYDNLDIFEFFIALQFILTSLQSAEGDNVEAISKWKDVTDEDRHCRKSKSAH